ncbi:DUF4251 domain-containing protein [Flavobacterium sp.]|uniref:DUF4251 domain-containing protein n=1 Tax=Flavobacterium sp. TaxID=239 RepID=UPI002C4B1415|nr:DUF4251 domain-containing protein [Flavobacterium sp.]HSD08387.1 DUF4251 domain-containing protein [Flavobacterium sp.]
MKTLIMTFFISFSMMIGFAQEKTKKQLKDEKKATQLKATEALVDSREYEFEADMAYPQGTRSINLTTNPNYFRVKKDTIDSQMPFFGRAYSNVGYGSNEGGMDFKGLVKDYSIKKTSKNFTIKGEVKGDSDTFDFVLTVYYDGDANLSISSTHRSPISYNGRIQKLEIKKNNK